MNRNKRNTFNCNLKQGHKIVYKGTTNDLEKRAREHEADGKKFTHIQQIGRVKTEAGANRQEARQLSNYRKNHGGFNPRYNNAKNG